MNEVNVAEKKDGANKVKQKSDSSLEKETKELDDLVERLRGEEDSANKTNNSTTTGKQTPERSIRGEIKSLKKHGRKHGKSSKDKANTGRARTDPIVLLVSGESQDGSTVENDLDLGALQYQYGQQNQLSSIEEGNGVYAGDQEQPSKNEEQEDQQLPESKEQQDSSGESVANAQIPGPKNGDALKTDDETELEIDVEQAQGKPEEIVENAHQIPESENEDIPTNDEKEVELVVEQEAPERPETRINDTNQDKKDEETEGQSNDEDSQRENEDNELEEKANDEQIKDVRDVQDVEDIVVDEEEPQQQFRRRRSTAYEPKTLEQFDLDGSERDEKVVSLRQGFRFGQNSADPPTKTLLQRFIAEKEDGDKTFEQFDLDGRERESDRVVALRQGFRLGQTLDDNHKKPSHENDEKELKTFEEFNLDGSEREPLRVTTFKEDFRLGPSLEKPPDDSSINEDKNGTASEKPINEGESVRVAALRQFFRLGQGLDDPPDRNDSSLSTTIQENEWKILTLRGNNSEEEIVGEDNDVIDFIEGHLGDQKTTANENASELIGANNVSEAIPKLNGSVGTESEKLDKLLHDEVNSNTTANYEEEGTVDQVWQQYQRRFEGMHNLQNSGENLNQENNSEVFAAKEAPQMRGSDAGDMFGDNQLLNSEISEEDGINFAGAQTNPNIWTAADQNDIEEDVVANDSETENPIFFANNNNVKTEVVDDDDKKIVEGREGNQVEESQPAKTVEPDKNQADDDADDNTEEKLSKLLLKALGGAKRVKGSNKTKVIRLKLTSAGQPRKSPLSGGNKIASKVSRPQIPKTKVPSKRNKPAEDDFVDENPNKETDGGKVVEEISNYDDTEAENTKKKLPNKPKESATYSNSDLKGLKNVTKSLANTLEGSQGAIVNELHAILLELKAIRHHYYGDRNDSNNEELKKFLMNKHEQSSSNKHTGHRSVKNGDKSDSGELYGNKARRHSVARRETKDGSNKRTKFEPHRGNIRKVAGSNSEEAGDEGNTDPAEEERVKTSNSQKNLEAVSNVVTTGGFQIIPIELNKKRPETRSNILTYEPRQYVRTAQQTDDQSNINGNPYRRIPLTIIRVNPQVYNMQYIVEYL